MVARSGRVAERVIKKKKKKSCQNIGIQVLISSHLADADSVE